MTLSLDNALRKLTYRFMPWDLNIFVLSWLWLLISLTSGVTQSWLLHLNHLGASIYQVKRYLVLDKIKLREGLKTSEIYIVCIVITKLLLWLLQVHKGNGTRVLRFFRFHYYYKCMICSAWRVGFTNWQILLVKSVHLFGTVLFGDGGGGKIAYNFIELRPQIQNCCIYYFLSIGMEQSIDMFSIWIIKLW